MFPYLFKIGQFEIRIYSLMLMTAVIIAMYFIPRKAVKIGFKKVSIENLLIVTFLSGILGARLYYVIFNWSYFKDHPYEILAVWHGGLAIHGGLIFGILVSILMCKKLNMSVYKIGDLFAPFVLLGQGIGRFGNYANGEAHGVPTIIPPEIIFKLKPVFNKFWTSYLNKEGVINSANSLSNFYNKIAGTETFFTFQGKDYLIKEYVPWGISFPQKYDSIAYREFGTIPVHPTFFYEMILNFIGAFILFLFWRKDSQIGKGTIFALYIIFYALIRGFVTFFRADDLMFGPVRAPHIASLALILIACFWIKKSREQNLN